MTIIVNRTENKVEIRAPGPAGSIGPAGSSLRYQGQLLRTVSTTISGIVQNTYKPVTMSGSFDASIGSGIVVGSGFSLRNNSGQSLAFGVSVTTEASAGNQEHLGLMLTKNGALISGSEIRAHTGNSSSAAPMTVPNYCVMLNDGDEIGIAVADFSASVPIVLERTRLTMAV